MSSVANKFRNFTRALSHSDLEDDEEDKSFIGKSYNFFSKLSHHNNQDANQPYQRGAQNLSLTPKKTNGKRSEFI